MTYLGYHYFSLAQIGHLQQREKSIVCFSCKIDVFVRAAPLVQNRGTINNLKANKTRIMTVIAEIYLSVRINWQASMLQSVLQPWPLAIQFYSAILIIAFAVAPISLWNSIFGMFKLYGVHLYWVWDFLALIKYYGVKEWKIGRAVCGESLENVKFSCWKFNGKSDTK